MHVCRSQLLLTSLCAAVAHESLVAAAGASELCSGCCRFKHCQMHSELRKTSATAPPLIVTTIHVINTRNMNEHANIEMFTDYVIAVIGRVRANV